MGLEIDNGAWRRWQAARARQQNRMNASMFPGTQLGMRAALLADVPHLREVMIRTIRPRQQLELFPAAGAGAVRQPLAEVVLELHRYTWWGLGLFHLVALVRARRIIEQHRPLNVRVKVRCGFVV